MSWQDEKQNLLVELSTEKTAHSKTLSELEEERSALQGYGELVEQAQQQIQTLIHEQQSVRGENGRLVQELETVQNKLAAERANHGGHAEGAHDGVHSETYRSLMEQKQHLRIEELLAARDAAEVRAGEAQELVEGFSEQTTQLMDDLEEAKKETVALADKNKSFIKLIGSLKQQLQEAKQSAPSVEQAPSLDIATSETVANLESVIRQKDAILTMQQRAMQESNVKADKMAAELEQLGGQLDSFQSTRAKLEKQLKAAQSEASSAVSDQFQTQQQVEDLQDANTVLRSRVEDLQSEISRLQSRADPSFLMEKERVVTDLNQQLATVQKELAAATTAAAKGQAAENLQIRVAEMEAIVATVPKLKATVQKKEEIISQLKAESEGRIAALAVADKEMKAQTTKLARLEQELQENRSAAMVAAEKGADVATKELTKELEELGKVMSAQVDKAETDLSQVKAHANAEMSRIVHEKNQAYQKLQAQLTSEQELLEELRQDLVRATQERNEALEAQKQTVPQEAVNSAIAELEGSMKVLRAELNRSREQAAKVAEERDGLRERLKEGHDQLVQDISRVTQERNALRHRLERATLQVVALDADKTDVVNRVASCLAELKAASDEKARMVASVDQIRATFARYKDESQRETAKHRARELDLNKQLREMRLASDRERLQLSTQVNEIRAAFDDYKKEMAIVRRELPAKAEAEKAALTAQVNQIRSVYEKYRKETMEEVASLKEQLNRQTHETAMKKKEWQELFDRRTADLETKFRGASQKMEEQIQTSRQTMEENVAAEKRAGQEIAGRFARQLEKLQEEKQAMQDHVDAINQAYQQQKRDEAARKEKHVTLQKELVARVERATTLNKELAAQLETSKKSHESEVRRLVQERSELLSQAALIKKTFEQHQRGEEEAKQKRKRRAEDAKVAYNALAVQCSRQETEMAVLRRTVEEQGSRLDETEKGKKTWEAQLGAAQSSAMNLRTERDALVERSRGAETRVTQAEQKIHQLQQEAARLVRERENWRKRAEGQSEDSAELLRQRNLLRDAVLKLRDQSLNESGMGGKLAEQVAVLQSQLANERAINEGLKRRVQRERLGSRLEALDTVGRQIQDLKHVLSGDWSSISIANGSQLNVDSIARAPRGQTSFMTPASKTRTRAPPTTPMSQSKRIADELQTDKQRLEEMRQRISAMRETGAQEK